MVHCGELGHTGPEVTNKIFSGLNHFFIRQMFLCFIFAGLTIRAQVFTFGGPEIAPLPSDDLASDDLPSDDVPSDDLLPMQQEEDDTIAVARQVLLTGAPRHVRDFTDQQFQALASLHKGFMTRGLIQTHRTWHTTYSIGGTQADVWPGTATIFGGVHAAWLAQFENYVQGGTTSTVPWRVPKWNPVAEVPWQLPVPAAFASTFGTRTTNNANYQIPSFFTSTGTFYNGQTISYLDVECAEDFWRFVGLHNHNGVHAGLKDVMPDSSRSPLDPSFWLWHACLQRLFERWLAGPKGLQWAAQHPNHALLNPVDPQVFFSPEPFANEGFCGRREQQQLAVCSYLNELQQLVNQAADRTG